MRAVFRFVWAPLHFIYDPIFDDVMPPHFRLLQSDYYCSKRFATSVTTIKTHPLSLSRSRSLGSSVFVRSHSRYHLLILSALCSLILVM